MKKILIIKATRKMDVNQMAALSSYVQEQYFENKPIVLDSEIDYEVVECSDGPVVIPMLGGDD